jgi:hypothetical protein
LAKPSAAFPHTTSFTVTDLGIKEGKLHALLADAAVITG